MNSFRNVLQPTANKERPPKKGAQTFPFTKAEAKSPWKFIEDKFHDNLLKNIKNKTENIFEEILSPWRKKPKENAKVSPKIKATKLCW